MASNLLDAIRGNSLPQRQGVTDETGRLQQLLRAKSGRNVAGPEIGSSNLGEQQAVAQTNDTLTNQLAPQIALQQAGQNQQAANQETETAIQKQGIEQSRKFNTLESRMKTQSLLNEIERGRGQMDLASEKAAVNQLATNLRFENTKYIDDLQREGQKSRLDSDLGFQESLVNSIFGDDRKLLEQQLGGKSILSASDREFSKSMADMGLDYAYRMFQKDVTADKQRALYTGIGNVVTAGVGAAGKATEPTADTTNTADMSTGKGFTNSVPI